MFQGPNSPLYDGPKGERMSVDAALTQWHAAGVPYQQLSVGAAFYGWTTRTTSSNLSSQYVSFAKVQIQGDQYDTMSADPCPGSAKSYSGEIQWRSIASEGIDANKNSWKTSFDNTTETPYSISSRKRQIVTYDNGRWQKSCNGDFGPILNFIYLRWLYSKVVGEEGTVRKAAWRNCFLVVA